MRRWSSLLIAAATLFAGGPTPVQNERELTVTPRYGAPGRDSHRDWSGVHSRYLNPGVCWYRNSRRAEWIWGC